MKEITGTTRIFPVIGCPVEQVKAPTLFNAYFKHHDLDARVLPFKIEPQRYREAVRTFMLTENVGGIFVSIPHKPMTLDAVDESTLRARVAGACNAVYRRADGVIMGDLLDGEGFIRALQHTCAERPLPWQSARALVVGCGGVGCAIVASLEAQGIAEIGLFDTDRGNVDALQARVREAYPQTRVSWAQALGCRIQKGKEMLIEQAPLYLELFGWPGVSANDFRNLEAL